MCGRYSLDRPKDVQAHFDFIDWHERRVEPNFNIAPTQDILTIIQRQGAVPEAQLASWGLRPHWLEPDSRHRPLINVRAETVASSGMSRGALARTRCLIPATGFYEWRAESSGKGKTPMYIRRHFACVIGRDYVYVRPSVIAGLGDEAITTLHVHD